VGDGGTVEVGKATTKQMVTRQRQSGRQPLMASCGRGHTALLHQQDFSLAHWKTKKGVQQKRRWRKKPHTYNQKVLGDN
jgi:hypothetical protein